MLHSVQHDYKAQGGEMTRNQIKKMGDRKRRTSLSGLMGEADAAVTAAMMASGAMQPEQQPVGLSYEQQAQLEMERVRANAESRAKEAMAKAVAAEHDMIKGAILSSEDPEQNPRFSELERRLNEVYREVAFTQKVIRKTDDEAWMVKATTDSAGNVVFQDRCYIPGIGEWQQPRFLTNPRHRDELAHTDDTLGPVSPPPAMTRVRDHVKREWETMETWPEGQKKGDKKYELIEFEQNGFTRDDAFHEAVSKLHRAKTLKDGKPNEEPPTAPNCTAARKCVESAIRILQRVHGTKSREYQQAMFMHGVLCEAQSDMNGAKKSFNKALAVARHRSRMIHPRNFHDPIHGYTDDVKKMQRCCDRIEQSVAKRWSDAHERKFQDTRHRWTLVARKALA